jgi:hypothetical protein
VKTADVNAWSGVQMLMNEPRSQLAESQNASTSSSNRSNPPTAQNNAHLLYCIFNMLQNQLTALRVPAFQRTTVYGRNGNVKLIDRATRLYSAAAHELESGNQIGMGGYSSSTSEHVQDIASAEQVRCFWPGIGAGQIRAPLATRTPRAPRTPLAPLAPLTNMKQRVRHSQTCSGSLC